MRIFGVMFLILGSATFAVAGTSTVPEINGNMAASALALLAGGMLVIRGRKRK